MSFAPGQEARLHLGSLPTGGLNEHLYVLFAGHQRDMLLQQLAPPKRRYRRSVFLYYSLPIREYNNIFSGEKETVKGLSLLLGPRPSTSFDEPSRFSPRLDLHPEPLEHAWPVLLRDISVPGNSKHCHSAPHNAVSES
jgi:hypothetical protein